MENTLVTTNSHTTKLSDNKLLVPGNRTNLVEKVFFIFITKVQNGIHQALQLKFCLAYLVAYLFP